MTDKIIPFGQQDSHPSGFTTAQFRKLDELYSRAAAQKILNYRTVEANFDEGTASYTYYQSPSQAPLFQFVIRKVGPRTMIYEVYAQGRGRIAKSGMFERAYERLSDEIVALLK